MAISLYNKYCHCSFTMLPRLLYQLYAPLVMVSFPFLVNICIWKGPKCLEVMCLRVIPLPMTALCGSINALAPQPPILVTSLCPAFPCKNEQKRYQLKDWTTPTLSGIFSSKFFFPTLLQCHFALILI